MYTLHIFHLNLVGIKHKEYFNACHCKKNLSKCLGIVMIKVNQQCPGSFKNIDVIAQVWSVACCRNASRSSCLSANSSALGVVCLPGTAPARPRST